MRRWDEARAHLEQRHAGKVTEKGWVLFDVEVPNGLVQRMAVAPMNALGELCLSVVAEVCRRGALAPQVVRAQNTAIGRPALLLVGDVQYLLHQLLILDGLVEATLDRALDALAQEAMALRAIAHDPGARPTYCLAHYSE